MKRIGLLFLLVVMLGLSGCAAGQKIAHVYTPEGGAMTTPADTYPVAITVVDAREYVMTGNKEACYVGIYRAGYGNTWDVRTEGEIPLAQAIKRDLTTDLKNAGFTVAENGAERQVEIVIRDYNFDCYLNCRVWHNLLVQIKNASGDVLHAQGINNNQNVSGSMLWGPKAAMEREIPKIYARMIRNIVRDSPEAIDALKRSAIPSAP